VYDSNLVARPSVQLGTAARSFALLLAGVSASIMTAGWLFFPPSVAGA
jgi:hypothetical protein